MTESDAMDDQLHDRLAIRDLIENWWYGATPATGSGFARSGSTTARMMATWTQGTADEFIEMSKQGLGQGRLHPAFPRRPVDRSCRQPRDLADQDDHLATGIGT